MNIQLYTTTLEYPPSQDFHWRRIPLVNLNGPHLFEPVIGDFIKVSTGFYPFSNRPMVANYENSNPIYMDELKRTSRDAALGKFVVLSPLLPLSITAAP